MVSQHAHRLPDRYAACGGAAPTPWISDGLSKKRYGHAKNNPKAVARFIHFDENAAVARLTGLEPATSGVTGRHSNQLSYNRPLRTLANQSVRS